MFARGRGFPQIITQIFADTGFYPRPSAPFYPRISASSWSLFLLAVTVGLAGTAGAEDARKEPVTIEKTSDQLHFKLPPDWPIEKRAGMVQPIPVEEYLAMKFKALEARLQALEQRLSGLDLRLRVLEEGLPKRSPGLKSSETAPPNP